jgi:hypothetical protein
MRGVKLDRAIWPPVAAARPANRTATLSEEVCIMRCHRRLSNGLCVVCLVGRPCGRVLEASRAIVLSSRSAQETSCAETRACG